MDCNIRVSGIKEGEHKYFFDINDQFFTSFLNPEIKKGKLNVIATLLKNQDKITISIKINGIISNIPCDLCASGLDIKILNDSSFLITEKKKDLDSSDDIIYINKHQKTINISQLIYENITLSLPTQRVHSGENNAQCDKEMINLIENYKSRSNYKIQDLNPISEKLNKIKDIIQ